MSNNDLEQILGDIKTEAKVIRNKVSSFNGDVDNLLAMHGNFDFDLLQFSGPFFGMARAMETDLNVLIEDIESTIEDTTPEGRERVYNHAQPIFMARRDPQMHIDRPDFNDPLTYYLQFASILAGTYETGEEVIAPTLYKDFFLKEILRKSLIGLPIFREKSVSDIGPEAIRMGKAQLRYLQSAYEFDHEKTLQEYSSLLTRIERSIRPHVENPQFKGLRKRQIASIEFQPGPSVSTPSENYVEIQRDKLASKLIQRLVDSSDWRKNIRSVANYILEATKLKEPDIFDTNEFLRYDSRSRQFRTTDIDRVYKRDIFGFSDNVDEVYDLLEAFAMGTEIPNIALIGREGVGKTMTLRYAANKIKNLKVVMISSDQLHSLDELVERVSQREYQTLICVDDLQFNDARYDTWIETFKEVTSGVKELPKNVSIGISVNPESFEKLDDSVKARFGYRARYDFDESNRPLIRRILQKYARQYGVTYTPGLMNDLFSDSQDVGRYITPRAIMDFAKAKAALVIVTK